MVAVGGEINCKSCVCGKSDESVNLRLAVAINSKFGPLKRERKKGGRIETEWIVGGRVLAFDVGFGLVHYILVLFNSSLRLAAKRLPTVRLIEL